MADQGALGEVATGGGGGWVLSGGFREQSFWLLLQIFIFFFRNSGAYSPWSTDNPGLFSQLHQVSVCLYQLGISTAPSSCVCMCVPVPVPTLSVASIK